jgi:hypothetical protein
MIARSLKKIVRFWTYDDNSKMLASEGVLLAALGVLLYFVRRHIGR